MRRWNTYTGHIGAGGHDHSHDASSDHTHDIEETEGVDLFPQIAMDKVQCLNERNTGIGKFCLKPYAKRLDHSRFLLSDEDDAECILHIPFSEAVRCTGICICADDNGTAPRIAKIFVNRNDVDFSLAEELKADMKLTDMHRDVSAEVFYFTPRSGKFTTCHSLTIYVSDNWGGDSTRINYIGFKGINTKLKRQIVHAVYEVRGCPSENQTLASSAAPQLGK